MAAASLFAVLAGCGAPPASLAEKHGLELALVIAADRSDENLSIRTDRAVLQMRFAAIEQASCKAIPGLGATLNGVDMRVVDPGGVFVDGESWRCSFPTFEAELGATDWTSGDATIEIADEGSSVTARFPEMMTPRQVELVDPPSEIAPGTAIEARLLPGIDAVAPRDVRLYQEGVPSAILDGAVAGVEVLDPKFVRVQIPASASGRLKLQFNGSFEHASPSCSEAECAGSVRTSATIAFDLSK